MIAKSYIKNNLDQIEKLYNTSSSIQKGLFYSKLAMLELCGWIEITMDDIVLRHSKRILRVNSNINFIENTVIKKTYGFEYDRHFRRMLMHVIGLKGVEELERGIDSVKFQLMVSALRSLKPYRDQEAHEYIKGTTRTLDAPSVTKRRFVDVSNGLKDIDTYLRQQ
jgi:hypothetical protein